MDVQSARPIATFIPTRKNNSCPACGNTEGDCRYLDEAILCMGFNSAKKGEVVNGNYKVVKFTKDGLWAILLPSNEKWNDTKLQDWLEKRRRDIEEEKKQRQKYLTGLLPVSQRDTEYRTLLAKLGWGDVHQQELERRGLTQEEIKFAYDLTYIRTWQRGLNLTGLSPKLAGVAANKLLGVKGFVISAIDAAGNITGFQVATDDRKKFAKYLWVSSRNQGGNGPHLPTGELPLFVWRYPDVTEITATWLCEGSLKSLIVAIKLWLRYGIRDIQVIGGSGANFAGSQQALLAALPSDTNHQITLQPDAGSKQNTYIMRHYRRTIDLLRSVKYSPQIGWWGQESKEDSDIDEKPDILDFEYLKPNEFFGEESVQLFTPIPQVANLQRIYREIDFVSIIDAYTQLLLDGTQREIEEFKINTRQRYPSLQPSELGKLLEAIEKDFFNFQAFLEESVNIKRMVQSSEATINLFDFLPQSLATPLARYCQWQQIQHAALLTGLITSISSLHKVGTRLLISRTLNFYVPPTLYSAIVAESGSKKSPIFRATASLPLRKMKETRFAQYQKELKDYELLTADAKEPTDIPPKPLPPPVFYFTDATGEGLKAQAHKAPHKALLLLADELAGFFANQNKYSNGKGSDRQDLLSYFDGTGSISLRAASPQVDVPIIHLSILGTIQPEVLKDLIGSTNGVDKDGAWARWLFVVLQNIPGTMPDYDNDDVGVDCIDLLYGFFEKVFSLPKVEYRLSRAAYTMYRNMYIQLEKLRVSHPDPVMRAVLAKGEGIIGRLALNLHVIGELGLDRTPPSTKISLETMQKAIALWEFYIGQIRLAVCSSFDQNSIAPQILKVIDLSKRKQSCVEEGWVNAAEIQRNMSKKMRPTADDARQWMIQCQQLGYGELRGTGSKLEFRFANKNRSTIGNQPIAETIEEQGLDGTIGFIDQVGTNPASYDIHSTSSQQPEEEVIDGYGFNRSTIGHGPIAETIEEQGFDETIGSIEQVGTSPAGYDIHSPDSHQPEDKIDITPSGDLLNQQNPESLENTSNPLTYRLTNSAPIVGQVDTSTMVNTVSTSETRWHGSMVRLKTGLPQMEPFDQQHYDRIQEKSAYTTGAVEGEPYVHTGNRNIFMVNVSFLNGCTPVPCDWLDII